MERAAPWPGEGGRDGGGWASVERRSAQQIWYRITGTLPAGFPLHPAQVVLDIAVAVVIAVVLPRHRSTRLWVAVLTIPMAWVASYAVDNFYSATGA